MAGTGRAALECLEREHFDAVLMDVQMPEMSGLDATRAWRAREAEEGRARTPILAVTAHAFAEDRRRCLDAGMDAYLAKPLDSAALLRTLEELTAPGAGEVEVVEEAELVAPGAPAFDRDALVELMGGDLELAREVVQALLKDCGALLTTLDRAVASGDAAAVRTAAHKVRETVAAVAAPGASLAADDLAAAAGSGAPSAMTERAASLTNEMARLSAALEEFLETATASPEHSGT